MKLIFRVIIVVLLALLIPRLTASAKPARGHWYRKLDPNACFTETVEAALDELKSYVKIHRELGLGRNTEYFVESITSLEPRGPFERRILFINSQGLRSRLFSLQMNVELTDCYADLVSIESAK